MNTGTFVTFGQQYWKQEVSVRQLLGHIKHPKHEHTTAVTSSDFSKLLLGLDKHYISVKKANSSATKDAICNPFRLLLLISNSSTTLLQMVHKTCGTLRQKSLRKMHAEFAYSGPLWLLDRCIKIVEHPKASLWFGWGLAKVCHHAAIIIRKRKKKTAVQHHQKSQIALPHEKSPIALPHQKSLIALSSEKPNCSAIISKTQLLYHHQKSPTALLSSVKPNCSALSEKPNCSAIMRKA